MTPSHKTSPSSVLKITESISLTWKYKPLPMDLQLLEQGLVHSRCSRSILPWTLVKSLVLWFSLLLPALPVVRASYGLALFRWLLYPLASKCGYRTPPPHHESPLAPISAFQPKKSRAPKFVLLLLQLFSSFLASVPPWSHMFAISYVLAKQSTSE